MLNHLTQLAGIHVPSEPIEITPLADGGMGSFQIGKGNRRMRTQAAEISFKDSDDTLVVATLNLDEEGILFEVDIWKVDFTPLMTWPTEVQLK